MSGGQVYLYGAIIGVTNGVVSGTTIKNIITTAACQYIVARTGLQVIIARIALHNIIAIAGNDVFNAANTVGFAGCGIGGFAIAKVNILGGIART